MRVFAYHKQSKHSYRKGYAPGPKRLSWDSQPNPYRIFASAPQTSLSFLRVATASPSILCHKDKVKPIDSENAIDCISKLFFYSLSLSAMKSIPGGSSWDLRVNPSSGNLHPTETFIILPQGLYHYMPKEHALALRCSFESNPSFSELCSDLNLSREKTKGLIAFSSILWRESWKYGSRALRYCNHDVGHAIAALTISASLQGLETRVMDSIDANVLEKLIGIDRVEDYQVVEEIDVIHCLIAVGSEFEPNLGDPRDRNLEKFFRSVKQAKWFGRANRLSSEFIDWDGIAEAEESLRFCSRQLSSFSPSKEFVFSGQIPFKDSSHSLPELIRNRRSVWEMNPSYQMRNQDFWDILKLLVSVNQESPVWNAVQHWKCRIHLAIFVHRVERVESGLYIFSRTRPDDQGFASFASTINLDLESCEVLSDSSLELKLFRYLAGDVSQLAGTLCCQQNIARDGAFTVLMMGNLGEAVEDEGPAAYERIHWESGMIGQLLYLGAEAAGVNGTGIGCFFDTEIHQDVFGIPDDSCWQCFYGFAVGEGVPDRRIASTDPYASIRR